MQKVRARASFYVYHGAFLSCKGTQLSQKTAWPEFALEDVQDPRPKQMNGSPIMKLLFLGLVIVATCACVGLAVLSDSEAFPALRLLCALGLF